MAKLLDDLMARVGADWEPTKQERLQSQYPHVYLKCMLLWLIL